jgi:hypothetical protein
MSRRSSTLLVCAFVGMCLPTVAQSQLIVSDPGNLFANTITSAQSTLTALASAQTAANTILDLTPLDEIIMASGIIEGIAQLADIIAQIEVLDSDVQSLQRQITALFGLETAPASTSALRERLAEIRRLRWECYSYAMKLQTLIKTALRTLQHLGTLVTSVSAFLGNKQAQQALVQVTASTNTTLMVMAAQTAAYQRAGSVDKMEELLTIESLRRIQEATMADWPRRR